MLQHIRCLPISIDTLLKWDKVAKRIDELIQLDRYLNKKEKEYYPTFLHNQLQHQLEYERKSINQSLIPESSDDLQNENIPKEYQWNLGDSVYVEVDCARMLDNILFLFY